MFKKSAATEPLSVSETLQRYLQRLLKLENFYHLIPTDLAVLSELI